METTHPARLLAHALAINRWRTRVQLWPQTLVLGLASVGLVVLVIVLLHDRAAGPAAILMDWIRQHAGITTALVFGMAFLSVARVLQHADDTHRSGPFAAIAVSTRATARWRDGLAIAAAARLAAGIVGGLVLASWVAGASRVPTGIAALWLVAVILGTSAARWLAPRRARRDTRRGLSARRPAGPWRLLSRADLPHVPAFLAQSGQVAWRGGGAAAGLFVLLAIAPREAAAAIVPLVGMLLWRAVHATEQAHRHVAALHALLAAQPLQAGRILVAALPFTGAWLLVFLIALAPGLVLAGLPASGVALVAVFVGALAVTDLLLAVRHRDDPRRFARSRLVAMTLAFVLVIQAPPLLLGWPLAWGLILRRLAP